MSELKETMKQVLITIIGFCSLTGLFIIMTEYFSIGMDIVGFVFGCIFVIPSSYYWGVNTIEGLNLIKKLIKGEKI